MIRGIRVVLGVALLWGVLGAIGYRLGWESHAGHGRSSLVGSARAILARDRSCSESQLAPSTGQLAGLLVIPALGIDAPVEQGTSNAVLAVAVGHFEATPWPGASGTSALLAHDVSYFTNIDKLVPGDTIRFEWPCVTDVFQVSRHAVVKAGSPLPQVPGTSLVLDTCWPTNALWYTPDRYLVEASETSIAPRSATSSTPGAAPSGSGSLPGQAAEVGQWATSFTTPAPPALVAQGLGLTTNEAPMGTMAMAGSPSMAWEQSPAPLAIEKAALEAYFGGLHSARQGEAAWWSALAPGVAMPAPLQGAMVTSHYAPLNVTITAQGATPQAVQLDTVVGLSGGSAPGRYAEQVTEAVHGSTLVITSWEVHHA